MDSKYEQDLMLKGHIIDQMYSKIVKFEPDINLENLKIDVELDEAKLRKIHKKLYESSEIIIENIPAFVGSD